MDDARQLSQARAQDTSLAEESQAFTVETLRTQKHIFLTSPPGVGKTTMIRRLLERLWKEADELTANITGFYTEEVRDAKGQRVGFDVVCVGAKQGAQHVRCSLARLGQDPPRIGKYTVNVAAFEDFAVPVLELAVPLPLVGNADSSDGMREVMSYHWEENCDACSVQTSSQDLDESRLGGEGEAWTAKPMKGGNSKSRLCICDEVGKMALLSSKFPSVLHAALDGGAIVLGTLPQPAKGQRDHELVEHVKKRADVCVFRITRGNRDTIVEHVYELLRKSLARDCARRASPTVQISDHIGGTADTMCHGEMAGIHVTVSSVFPPEGDASSHADLERIATPRIDPQEACADGSAATTGAEVAVKVTKLRDREAKAKEQAKNREIAAKRAREGRKLRAEARKKARELAKSGVAVGVDDGPDMEVFEDAEEHLGRDGDTDVEALDMVLDVEKPLGMVCRTGSHESQQPARKLARASSRSSLDRGHAPAILPRSTADDCVLLDDG